jgi:drug/metabolite transporter (DMT)-like permease
MELIGEMAALGTAGCWAGGTLLFAQAGRRIGSYNVNKLRIPMAVVFLIVILFFRTGTLFPIWLESHQLFYLALSGIVGLTIGDTFYFRCLVILGPRQGALMMSLAPVITALLAFFMLGETLTILAITGILVTLGGVSWVTTDRKDDQSGRSTEGSKFLGILMGIGGATGQALGLVLAKEGMGSVVDPMAATLVRMLAAAISIWLIALLRGEGLHTVKRLTDRHALLALLGASFLGPTIGVWLSLVAVKLTEAGIAATIMSTFPILVIPLAMIFHGERPSWRSVLGTVISVIGVAMLFLE